MFGLLKKLNMNGEGNPQTKCPGIIKLCGGNVWKQHTYRLGRAHFEGNNIF